MQRLTASDGRSNDMFGRLHAVAMANSQIVVGNNQFSGAVYVFTTITQNDRESNYYSQLAILTPQVQQDEDRFGVAVDIDGDGIVVGAPGTNNYTGAVYLFRKKNSTTTTSTSDSANPPSFYTEMAQITVASGATPGDYFGAAVAIQGNRVLVGAHDVPIGNRTNVGSAYLFAIYPNQTWEQLFQFQMNDPVENARFGISLALEGNVVVIGAVGADAAFIFETVDNTTDSSWTQVAKLVPSGSTDSTNRTFGCAVAMAGNWVVVGASRDQNRNGENAGAAFVFHKTSSNSWTLVSKLMAADGAANDTFGTSVAISKNASTIVVGADLADWNEKILDSGSIYRFSQSNGTWTQTGKFFASDSETGDNLGRSVALEGNILVAGAPGDDESTGSVYTFNLTAPPPTPDTPETPPPDGPDTPKSSNSLSQGAIIALVTMFGVVVIAGVVTTLIYKKWKLQQQHKKREEMQTLPSPVVGLDPQSPPLIAEMVTEEPPAMAELVILPDQLTSSLDRTIEADAIEEEEEYDSATASHKESLDTSVGSSLHYKDQVRSVAQGPQRLSYTVKKSQQSDD
jgi:hypothetical protein